MSVLFKALRVFPPSSGCTAPSYLPAAREWGEGEGEATIRHAEHFVQQRGSSQLRVGCGFQFIKQQIIPRLRVRHRRIRYLARGKKIVSLIFN